MVTWQRGPVLRIALESSKGLLKSIYQWGTQKKKGVGGTIPYGEGTEPLQNSRLKDHDAIILKQMCQCIPILKEEEVTTAPE